MANGRYLMVEQLGEGGMASVFRAFDQRLQVWRAIKILLPQFADKPKIARRFEAEAQTMALLEHRHIVRVYDVGTDGSNIAYIVMELVEGGCLVDWLEHHGPMPARMAARATQEVCLGLAAAHDKGIVHRDVKPHNVMVTREGVCRVTDFGIARVGDSQNSQTKTGSVMGTWGYMAPEQRTNAKGVDERGDVYAVGATLYTLLTDRMPMDLFAAERNASILEGIDEALIPVLIKSTEYDREDRYPNVMAMHEALEEVYEQLPAIPEGTKPLALDAVRTTAPPDPTKFVPATEIGEGGKPVASPTLLPDGEQTVLHPLDSAQMTVAPDPASRTDPGPGPRRNDSGDPLLGSLETVVLSGSDVSVGGTPAPADERRAITTTNAALTGAAVTIWGVLGAVLLLILLIGAAWFMLGADPPVQPSPKPVVEQPGPKPVEPTPAGPKPTEPGPQSLGPKPTVPKPTGPKPVAPIAVPAAPVPAVPVPIEPVPPVEPVVVKCVKLASPVAWNSSKSGVLFRFRQCEGDFPTGKRVVLHYRSKGETAYRGKPLGVSSKKWTWRLPADQIQKKVEWYVDGDMGTIGAAGKPKVFVP